ncbi:complex I NDUFA9 subunit family protein [Halorussus sp. JP-T4]|nr:complex I NDUFA9 subunit family protein [Halorussus sp. JP-T4]
MKVLVAGGTGFVGTALVQELTARNHDVTVLARSPEDADLPAGVDRVTLDLTSADATAVRESLADHDAVVNLIALSPLFTPSGGNEMHETVHLGATEALIAAAETAGISRFVQISALGADTDGDTHYIRAKGRAETVVRDSALDWVIVRPSVVFGDGGEFVDFTRLLTTPYVSGLPSGGSTRFQPIWVGDLAPMLADCVDEEDRGGETYELGGPEVLTLADVARQIYAAEGKSLRVLPIPMPLAELGLTVGGAVPGFPMGPDQYRSLRFDNTVGGGDSDANDVHAFGVGPAELRTFDDYLAGGDGDGGSETDSESVLVGVETLGLFTFLSIAWFLPEVVDIYSIPGLVLLIIPSYLVNMVFYDGFFGLEAVVYALESIVGESPSLWDAGLLVTYYLFSVATVALGRALKRRFRLVSADEQPSNAQ